MSKAPFLVPSLVTLRAEFNIVGPQRDKASDGWIGDAAHQKEVSDHNPDENGAVHAIDVDNSGPWLNAFSFTTLMETIRIRHLAGQDNRAHYIIWNRQYASINSRWEWLAYTGSSAHTEHGHISVLHNTYAETSTKPWGIAALLEEAVTNEDKQDIIDGVLKGLYNAWNKPDAIWVDEHGNTRTTPASALTLAMRNSQAILNQLPTLAPHDPPSTPH